MSNIISLSSKKKADLISELLRTSAKESYCFANTDINKIVEILDKVSIKWQEESHLFHDALTGLNNQWPNTKESNRENLKFISGLLKKENILARLKGDFKNIDTLNGASNVEEYSGKIFYAPLGVLLHVTAGNIFLGAIDSIIMGILTKNYSLIKLSHQNHFIPNLFLESIKAVDEESLIFPFVKLLSWKGGDQEVESLLKKGVDGIIAWGGEEMVSSYQQDLPAKVKLIQHGPKISFQVITKEFLKAHDQCYKAIAKDVITFDQAACANSQNIFIEEGVNYSEFSQKLKQAFENKSVLKRKKISPDEHVELLKDRQEGLFYEFLSGNESIVGDDFQLQFDHKILAPTALNRSLKIKYFDSQKQLFQDLKPFSFYLQTCGLGALQSEAGQYKKNLMLAGVNRVTKLGGMLESIDGSPHDGQYSLMELTRVCSDESGEGFEDFLENNEAPFYSEYRGEPLDMYPLIDGDTLAKHSLIKDKKFLDPSADSGYMYSSGGTTGNPKYCFYDYKEFHQVSRLLATSYQALGVKKGDHVANLFMAGNMWSSFNAVQDALKECQTIQFPIGGLVEAKDFQFLVEKFKISILFGLPGMLIKLANQTRGLQISKIFYAGESFSKEGLEFIKAAWGCDEVYSAGYASVDVGPIGYQGKDCKDGEHYLFDDLIKMEIVDGEAVVTSKIRKKMPIIRYKTGDRVELISEVNGKTKFKLLGRVDKKINIWSSRFEFSEVSEVLAQLGYNKPFQIIINKERKEDRYIEYLELQLMEEINHQAFLKSFYAKLKDVSDTHEFQFLKDKIRINSNGPDLNIKTGKFRKIIDLRL